MGHKEDPRTQKLQTENWKSFISWTKSHGKMVLPIPEKAVIYAGYPEAELRAFQKFLLAEDELVGIWKSIDDVNKNIVEWTGHHHYDKLSDVLKRIKKPLPKLVYTQGNLAGKAKANFQSMSHCVSLMTSREDKFLDRGKHNAVWQELSRLYVKNAMGDVAIWEGRKKNYKQVDAGRQLINTEIIEMLKKKTLPADTMKKVVAIAKRHEVFYKKQRIEFEKMIAAAKKSIEKASIE